MLGKKDKKTISKEDINNEIKRLKDIEKDLEFTYPLSIPLNGLILNGPIPHRAHLDFYVDGKVQLVISENPDVVTIPSKIDIEAFDPEEFIEKLKQVMVWRGRVYDLKRELETSEVYKLMKSLEGNSVYEGKTNE